MFILSRKACFLTRTSANTFLWVYFGKKELLAKFPIFWSNPWSNPFGKMPIFWGFWNRCFCCWERLFCYIKRRKWFFGDIFSRSMTWEYRWLQEVTGGYEGLHGVTRGYKGLQGFTRGDRGWQGFAKDYRNFFLTRTFPDSFSWSILHKNQSWRNLKFFSKNDGLTTLEKS